MDTTKSNKIVRRFNEREFKSVRRYQEFSGTFKTKPAEVFPLLCPTREADWIPGWDAHLVYTSTGYAEDKCVWTTDSKNTVGDGIWTFTGFKKDEFIEFVKFQPDVLTHCKVGLVDNGDGTTTGTWYVTRTGLTEKGNKEVEKLKEGKQKGGPMVMMVEHYLKKGKTISKAQLMVAGVLHGHG